MMIHPSSCVCLRIHEAAFEDGSYNSAEAEHDEFKKVTSDKEQLELDNLNCIHLVPVPLVGIPSDLPQRGPNIFLL